MGKFSLDDYRKQWPRVGGVLAMTVGGAAALTDGKMKKSRLISLLPCCSRKPSGSASPR
ncbi:hypothetical protein [Actinoallomurus sp. CA-142502]|uniref:hypothetical protein n=1 Tax=Actinoallomurus sp. CA-142502 TaxID=3239885 RepID=UPI003D8EBA7E